MKKYLIILIMAYLTSIFNMPSFAQQSRIVGGESVVDPSKYPWIAAIVDSIEIEEDINYGQFCGGTLINPDWVVTAAHCVFDSYDELIAPEDIDVVLGTVDLKANPNSYERIEVVRIIPHPDYNSYLTDNDVALLKLKRSSAQQPIDFLSTSETDSYIVDNSTNQYNQLIGTTLGWGEMEAQRTYPSILQEVDLPLVSNQECSSFYEYGEITDNMLCAGYVEGGKDSCFGDSGGPLVITQNDGKYTLTGIVSWGNGCAQPNSYGVYTRVSKMRDWILNQIKLSSAPIVLTDTTPTTIYSGSNITVYGYSGTNNLTIQSGAQAKLINFPGINLITIQGKSSQFLISRSGATVTFNSQTSGTVVKMPATANTQLIVFDDLTAIMQIKSNKVMLGNQVVTKTETVVNP